MDHAARVAAMKRDAFTLPKPTSRDGGSDKLRWLGRRVRALRPESVNPLQESNV